MNMTIKAFYSWSLSRFRNDCIFANIMGEIEKDLCKDRNEKLERDIITNMAKQLSNQIDKALIDKLSKKWKH